MNTYFITASEIAEVLGMSIPYAYKLISKMNAELAQKGYIVIKGRVSRKYFVERIYGKEEE